MGLDAPHQVTRRLVRVRATARVRVRDGISGQGEGEGACRISCTADSFALVL